MDDRRDFWWPSPSAEHVRVVHLDLPPEGFAAERGGVLPEIQVGYEAWGEPNRTSSNTVLIAHPLTTDVHATGTFLRRTLGWWDPLIGPGRPIDTDRWFVLCPNLIGGCFGTTGPRFPAPDGEPYLGRFPLLTPLDMMRVQRMFLDAIGIERVAMVIGPSMGGMVAWEWAVEGGDAIDLAVIIGAPIRTTAHQIGLNWLQRRGIELDLQGNETMADWGQMVARGVGMLSYRSAVGLEEKFGRDWFREPGSTLDDRGMYNIESWLRHHGKRSVRRFDPYSYILFSRAMDLHDIGEGRGGLIPALDRVRCRTVVVGVSSDDLYPPGGVHQGADILNRLGRPVEYHEIRSPHGHDAVFLEHGQLGGILRDLHLRPAGIVPTPAEREIRTVRVGILGAGRVARLFLRLLGERREAIRRNHGLRFDVVAAADTNRSVEPGDEFGTIPFGHDPDEVADRKDVDVIVEMTRGTDAHGTIERALRMGRPVVTPNKTLVREHGGALEATALAAGTRLAYHNAVAAGWPLLYAVERPLESMVVTSIEAMVSCACNLILERIEQGDSLEEAIDEARRLGLTEEDPTLDVSGWDSAQKLTVLVARSRRLWYSATDFAVRGLDTLDTRLPSRARDAGYRIKLAGVFRDGEGGAVAGVLPLAVPAEGYLGAVRGDDNVVVLRGGASGEMVHIGRGGGSLPVATAVLNDLLGLYIESRSWTGRYRRAPERAREPRFARHLSLTGSGAVAIHEAPTESSVPLLESMIDGD